MPANEAVNLPCNSQNINGALSDIDFAAGRRPGTCCLGEEGAMANSPRTASARKNNKEECLMEN